MLGAATKSYFGSALPAVRTHHLEASRANCLFKKKLKKYLSIKSSSDTDGSKAGDPMNIITLVMG